MYLLDICVYCVFDLVYFIYLCFIWCIAYCVCRLASSTHKIDKAAVCMGVLHFFDVTLATMYITSAQLALITICFELGTMERSIFGTYRVELIVLLFNKVVDLHNFEFVFMHLTAEEQGQVVGRIGYLNIFNPWKPNGYIALDLSRWEERQVAKILIHLSCAEAGEGWAEQKYQYPSLDTEPTPGWMLNVLWFQEETLPDGGVLTVNYNSGDGIRRNGAKPNLRLRSALLTLVLIDPNDLLWSYTLTSPDSTFVSQVYKPIEKFLFLKLNEELQKCNIHWSYTGPRDLDRLNRKKMGE